jgi:hypothetical protein
MSGGGWREERARRVDRGDGKPERREGRGSWGEGRAETGERKERGDIGEGRW